MPVAYLINRLFAINGLDIGLWFLACLTGAYLKRPFFLLHGLSEELVPRSNRNFPLR